MTAADGKPKFYTSENNEARYETIEEAIALDKKLINAWVGHPHFTIIDNKEKSFSAKIERCVDTVCKVIGLPTPQAFHKKFLLATLPHSIDINTPPNIKKEVFQCEKTFLSATATNDHTEAFIQKVGKNDSYVYNQEYRKYENNERVTTKRQISAREYIEMLDQAAPGYVRLKIFRQCFIYEQQYFLVDTYTNVD